MSKVSIWFPTQRYFYSLEELVNELLQSGLPMDQVKQTLTIICE